ncbi:E3 ubiquitin-protein ligase MARCHF3-like [Ixodes scapularis]
MPRWGTGTIGSVHRDCLERWIPRTADGKCQICQFQFTVCRQSKPIWWLLGDPKARRKVLGYLALGATFSASIALIFSLAWLYALRLSSRLGDRSAVLLVVLLAVQNVLWHYFPFLSFMYSFDAIKEWRRKNFSTKLVLGHVSATPRWLSVCST